jgi:hypothetical protein
VVYFGMGAKINDKLKISTYYWKIATAWIS